VFAQLVLALLALIAVSGCYSEPAAVNTQPPTPIASQAPIETPAPTAPPIITPAPTLTTTPTDAPPSPTVAPTPTPITSGSPSAACVDGWTSPSPGESAYEDGTGILGGYIGEPGPWTVAEVRYFTGPDAPGIIEPRYDPVYRWYFKAGLADDPSYRGRWLIEKRTDAILGVSAVASWDSAGYQSPDWTGFIGEGEPQTYIGLPGQWSGIPFDFVTGEGDGGQPGLPPEVVGCLAGT
jgi:hypothetical protein